MELELLSDGGECEGGRVSTVRPSVDYGDKSMESLEKQMHGVVNSTFPIDGCVQSTRGFTGDGDEITSTQPDHVTERGTDEGYAEVERMEVGGEGEVATTC